MLGPEIEYPRYSHEFAEFYVPLTGDTLWLGDNAHWVPRAAGHPNITRRGHHTRCEQKRFPYSLCIFGAKGTWSKNRESTGHGKLRQNRSRFDRLTDNVMHDNYFPIL